MQRDHPSLQSSQAFKNPRGNDENQLAISLRLLESNSRESEQIRPREATLPGSEQLNFTLAPQNQAQEVESFKWRLDLDSRINSKNPTFTLNNPTEKLFSPLQSLNVRAYDEKELAGEDLSLSCGSPSWDYASGEKGSSSSQSQARASLPGKEVDARPAINSTSTSSLGVGSLGSLNVSPLSEELEVKTEEEQWPSTSRRPSQNASSKQSTRPRSVAERMRRGRISVRLERLKATLPNTNPKLDTAAMLDDAVKYINTLKKQIRRLEEEAAILRQRIPQTPQGSSQVPSLSQIQQQIISDIPQNTQIPSALPTSVPLTHSIDASWRIGSNNNNINTSQEGNLAFFKDFRGT